MNPMTNLIQNSSHIAANLSTFDRLRFILVETSHPGNIGAVARAMKTMGFSQLYLVNPRFPDALKHPDAIAFASGAQDVLENARIVNSIEQALEGCDLAAAVSARLREFSPPILAPRSFAQRAAVPESGMVARVMGNERFGLPNQIVEQCNYLINIPANPDYSSLNLAQAVQIVAYECRIASLDAAAGAVLPDVSGTISAAIPVAISGDVGFKGVTASVADVAGMFQHLEQGLINIGFIDPANPKKLMSRLKRLLSRTQLETEEVNIFRGIAKKMLDK